MPTEPRRPTLAPALVACVLAATVSVGCSTESAGSGASGGSTGTATAGREGGAAGPSDGSGTRNGSGGGSGKASSSGDDAAAEGGGDGGPVDASTGYGTEEGVTSGLELPAEADEASETQEQSPATALRLASRPLVARPLPAAARARGRLVAGFPGFLRAGPGSVVGTSSLSPSGDRLQAALTGTSVQDATTLARSFRVRLARRGLAERETVPGADGSETVSFVRGRSTVTLTVGRDAGTTTYVVYAVLHAGQD